MKKRYCVNLSVDAHALLQKYASDNHMGSVSAAIEQLAWSTKTKQKSRTKEKEEIKNGNSITSS